uniref:Uncharacterized protein n=1 Tax=Avena sativa TaxID=4498 RepID=A0ACD5W8A1_AVESA
MVVVGEGAAWAHVEMMGLSDPPPTDASPSLQARMEEDPPPITASLGPIDRLIWRLKSLEGCCKHTLPMGISVNQIGKLREHLETFRKPLVNLSEMEETSSFRAKWWMKEVRELCYDTEDYLVQSCASKTLGSRIARYIIWWIQSKLKLRTRLSKFMARAQDLKKACETIIDLEIKAAISLNKEIKAEISLEEENIADIETLAAQLVHMLAFEDHKQTELKLVAISGFQGSGKTTLARTLYVKCKRKFQCWAFVRVSRNPDFRSLLTSILSQIKAPSPQGLCDVQGLISGISHHLQGKRYFIVIDDVRSPSVWDIISHAFPGGNFRSRMIVTTQSEQVEAAYSGYKLMKSAIFKMGATDDGYGTHTSTKEKNTVLNIRYNNLPLHLKTCLLYFSMYPEGSTVTKDDLAKRWVAEGFIARHRTEEISEVSQAKREETAEGPRGEIVEVPQDKTEETTKVPQNKTERIAHGYFDHLVARGMIQPVDRNHKGEVLSCTVHHTVLDLIRYKSKEDNFIVVVDNLESTLGHPDIVRRLSVQFGCEKSASIPESIILSQVRSLAFYGFLECVPSIAGHGFLQVLDLHIWSDEYKIFDLTTIGELCHLVHLKIKCNITVRLPWKIQRLHHLGTLELHAQVVAIPSDIAHLKKLLHIRCPSMADVRYLGDLTSLLDLQLTCFTVENLEEQIKCLRSILEKLSSLKCLAVVHASGSCSVNTVPANPSRICISHDSLCIVSPATLANLQRLELSRHCCIFSRVPNWIGELHELCILKIGVSQLSKEDIDILKGMPALTALSLHVQPMPAERIVFGKEGFSVLKYFKFACTVPWLKFEAGAMPSLEKLKLCFNSPVVDEQGTTRIIIIEYLPGLKEIFAIIGSAGADAGCSWWKSIRNDPGNPKVQLMGSIFYGDECRGVVTSEGSEEDENIEADIWIHMQPEPSGLPILAHCREEEPEDQPCISETISIANESESTGGHTGQEDATVVPVAGTNPCGSIWGNTANLDKMNETVHSLNPDIRRCLEFCSIFPRGSELRRDDLVRLWIAQGFVKTVCATDDVEDIAVGYIQDLVSRSFLQPVGSSSDTDCFTIHDVLHDILDKVAGNCFRIENAGIHRGEGWEGDVPRHIQHLLIQHYDGELISETIIGLEYLRTLIVHVVGADTTVEEKVIESICKRLPKLRVLAIAFSQVYNPIKKPNRFSFPESISQLKYLRYLGFRTYPSCHISLPNTLNKLQHIQVLDFGYGGLREFMVSALVNLRHISCQMHWKLRDVGRLSSLQTLPCGGFEVSNEQGRELKQLMDLNKLRGKLDICCLENVKSKAQALEANLAAKERVTELSLRWGYVDDATRCSAEVEADVLAGLCPPAGLEKLFLANFVGSRYPDWMLGQHGGGPKHLQVLHLSECSQLVSASGLAKAFPRLRLLQLWGCRWDALPDNMEHLTSLKELWIHACVNLRSLPTLPQSLENFALVYCNDELVKSCQAVGHPNWQKIEHIPHKEIY